MMTESIYNINRPDAMHLARLCFLSNIFVIRFRVQGRRTRKSGVTSHKRVFNQNQNKTENVNNAGVVSSSGTRLFVFLGAAHSLTAVLTIALSPFPPGLRAFSILSDNHWN